MECLNYIKDYYQYLAIDSKFLYEKLRKNPPPWGPEHTKAVQLIKQKAKQLPCLSIPNPHWGKIVEIDASDLGYGGILKQTNPHDQTEQLVRFTSSIWKQASINYPTIKKECFAIVKSVLKFQDDLLNKHFIIRVDCSATKQIFEKDVKNLSHKQIFANWHSQLSAYDFSVQYIKG